MEAIDIERLISPTVVDAILVLRVSPTGLLGLGFEYPLAGSSCGCPEVDILLFGITLPLMI